MTTSKNGRASLSSSAGALLTVPYSLTHGETRNFDSTTSFQDAAAYTVADPPYLSSQIKSSEWLQRYGLKSQKLTFDQILQQIGFKRVESFNAPVGKNVSAKYASNLYQEIQNDNGDRYVLTCRPEKLREFRNRLVRMLNLLRKRLTFLTSGSRRLFGILGEPSICFVCDCKTSDQRIFNQFQLAITSLIREQVIKIKRFNIIWISTDNEQFQEQPIDVTSTTIDEAVEWISKRKYTRSQISISSTCEAMLKAFTNTVHSIYLISEGNSSDSAREMLRDNIVKTRLSSKTPIPIHVASLFCQNNDTETFLRSIAQTADGSYFSYKIKNEITNLKTPSNLTDPTRIKLQFGANAPNSQHPIDISLMYKEINDCQNIIDRLEKILGLMRDENDKPAQTMDTMKSLDTFNMSNKGNKLGNNLQRSLIIQSSALFNHDENDMASIEWLKIYGVEAQKLDFFSVLQSAAFPHCDGVVAVHKPPENANGKTDHTAANPKTKLINAKYCDQFAHVTWPDGTIRHVYVTSELYRDYERRIRALLEKIKARLSWLKKGSREVFGTILEKNIYILIDTSKSMQNHLNFVKDKLRLLIQDQLFSKDRINMVSFNTIINPWRDRLTKVNDSMTQTQLQPWIDGLNAEGSTNTLGAVRFALGDSATEAIYLLTDGRPDQNERHILSQVQYRQIIPIHTIAFNCQDQTANQFLFDLAKQTGGRFHAFNYGLENASSIEIPESEDISYLKQEIVRGEKDLEHVADLRDECIGRTWSAENIQAKYKSLQLNELPATLPIQRSSTLDMTFQSSSSTMPQRIDRKKCSSVSLNRKRKSKSATQLFGQTGVIYINSDQWLLPETEDYLRMNGKQQRSLSTVETGEEEQQVVLTALTRRILTPYDEVISYLKRNSLVSKRLTILDVLRPTSITVKHPQYIQVIDRYVLAKVWDDILPFTYGSYADKFRLVNHYAVNLERYEVKLKDLIRDYYQFIAEFIWKCLSDDDKRIIGPRIYWISLSNEDQNRNAHESTRDQPTDDKESELFAWRKLTKDQQNKLLQRPAIFHEKTQEVLKTALKNAENESALQGVARMDVEIKRAIKFLQISADLRQYQKRADNQPKQPPIINRISSPNRKFGQRVICRYDGDGYFYLGSVQKSRTGRWIVLFDMDLEQEIIGHVLLPGNFNNQLKLFIQDYVLVRQLKETEEYWVPGVVLSLPSPFTLPPNLYKIQIYDPLPKQIDGDRRDMIRITLELFQRSVLYLQSINRISTAYGFVIHQGSKTPSPREKEFETIFRRMLISVTEKIDFMISLHTERFYQLQMILEDQMGAIRILQERSYNKPKVKVEYAQTNEISTGESTQTDSSPKPSPRPPISTRIDPDTPVYAVWSDDDGLVYKGIVVEAIDSETYKVERGDFPGVESNIPRHDIFLYSDLCRINRDIKFALIEYPDDSRHCLCPAVIRRHRLHEQKIKVRFYDCYDKDIPDDQDVIPITRSQFEHYTAFRIEKELSLINQVVVGLNNRSKSFMLGVIKDRVGTGHQYLIEWFDKDQTEQKEEHLFGAFTRRNKHRINGYVLAIDETDHLYKLAKTISISNDLSRLTVQFINLNRNEENSSPRTADVPTITTFVITREHFHIIIDRLQSRTSSSGGAALTQNFDSPTRQTTVTVDLEVSRVGGAHPKNET